MKKKVGSSVPDVPDVNTAESVSGSVKSSSVQKWKSREGSFEKPGQHRPAIPVGFNRPPSLEEQIVRVVRSQITKQTLRERAVELDPDFEDLDRDLSGPQSPHELVSDHELGEMTRWEKVAIDKERAAFDAKAEQWIDRRKAQAQQRKNIEREVKKNQEPVETAPKKGEKPD